MNEGIDTSHLPNAGELRAWGMKINPRAVASGGRLPRPLIAAWNKAHPDRPYRKSEGWHGMPAGYRAHGCRCDRCLEAGRRDGRERYRMGVEDGAA